MGKTSIIEQFMSSEHADVFDEDSQSEELGGQERLLTVDVNNVLAQLAMLEVTPDLETSTVAADHNPDCFVIVYAIDDRESFGKEKHSNK